MAVTSQLRPNAGPGEVWIAQWHAAGLIKPSAIKPAFATLEQRLIVRRLGTLDVQDQISLRKAICETIG